MDNVKAAAPSDKTVYIDIQKLVIPEDARKHSPEQVEVLANDLKASRQLQEIVVIPSGDQFEVRAGVGRVLAARKLGWERIRAYVADGATSYEKKHISFSENESRRSAHPLYQAKLLAAMLSEKTCSQKDLAQELGKDEATLSQYLSLTDIEPEAQESLLALPLSLRQMLEIRKLEKPEDALEAARVFGAKGPEGLKGFLRSKLGRRKGSGRGAGAKASSGEIVWKGSYLCIRRPFRPGKETVEDYIAWLAPALKKALEERPQPAARPRAQRATAPAGDKEEA